MLLVCGSHALLACPETWGCSWTSSLMEPSIFARLHSFLVVQAPQSRKQSRCVPASVCFRKKERRWLNELSTRQHPIFLPAWPIVDSASGGQHALVLILGFLALIEFGTRPDNPFPASLTSATSITSSKADDRQAPVRREHWVLSSIALGSLICSLHERLSDSSTLLAWSWSGFPASGPHPHVHAPLTLLAQVLATLLALALSPSPPPMTSHKAPSSSAPHPRTVTAFPNVSSHPLIFVVGVLSTYLLHTRAGWLGYTGGLLHAAFLTLITPPILQNAGAAARGCGAGRVFGVAWVVWVVFLFVGTFTVAYAFVPGAGPFREHTDW